MKTKREIVSRAAKNAMRAARGTIGWREAKRRAIAWCVKMSVTREPLTMKQRPPQAVGFRNDVDGVAGGVL